MRAPKNAPRGHAGFSRGELAVVAVTVVVLTALGVPQLVRSVERARAAEAVDYLTSVRIAQERYQAQYGTYAGKVADLDFEAKPPRTFVVAPAFAPGAGGSGLRDSWSLTMTRVGASAGCRAYSIVFTEAGFDARRSGIDPIGP